ncbi:MAG: diheme cytochrome c [Rubrivivax sp.]|nr:diheme cytochrome c [Rubrivivax sp.]
MSFTSSPHQRPGRAVGRRQWLALALLLAGSLQHPAQADSRLRPSSPAPAAYAQECASCHMAYPPSLLPAASWQRLMDGLSRHFGSDASMEPAPQAAVRAWLLANAAVDVRQREAPPQDRITRSAWFERKHREIAASTFSRPSIKSAAQCNACHARAEQGDFNDHDVRIPR